MDSVIIPGWLHPTCLSSYPAVSSNPCIDSTRYVRFSPNASDYPNLRFRNAQYLHDIHIQQPKGPRNPFNLAEELLDLRLRRFRFLPQASRRINSAAGGGLDGWHAQGVGKFINMGTVEGGTWQ